ncbi:MAG: hypothetical protein HY800_03195 [Ignavibacteriales bacterium]|nr:hypothetical protein [Ignavibacteriales bacterium]
MLVKSIFSVTIILIFIPLIFFIGSFNSCKNPTQPVTFDKTKFTLTFEDAACTEVWLKLILSADVSTRRVLLKRLSINQTGDTTTIYSMRMNVTDTLIVDEGLLPKHTYTYQAELLTDDGRLIHRSGPLTVTTMDTTSHDFSWDITYLGDGSSSVLRDVAIINDTLAYAVGEIYKKDSAGNFETEPYNLAVWNGSTWKLQKAIVYYQGYRVVPPLEGVFAFSPTDIWLTSSYPIHGDGTNWALYRLPDLGINASVSKIWGTSSSSIYFVGRNGSIVFFDGKTWRRIESGTKLSLLDIYGSKDNIVIAGVDISTYKGIVLKNNGMGWKTIAESNLITAAEIFKPKLYGAITSVLITDNNTIYAGGNLFYQYRFGKWNYVKSMPENYIGGNPNVYYRGFIYKIRGNKVNDLWIVGDRNTIRHSNGASWKQIGLPYDPASDVIWRSLSVKNNFCIAVGDGGNRAICINMKR